MVWSLKLVIMQLSIFCRNHSSPPPVHPQGFAKKICPHFWILILPRPGIFCSRSQGAGHLSINNFCHFHCYRKNWRQTTLWGLIFVALKFVFSKNYSNFKHVKSPSGNSAIFLKHNCLQNLSV